MEQPKQDQGELFPRDLTEERKEAQRQRRIKTPVGKFLTFVRRNLEARQMAAAEEEKNKNANP